LPRAQAPLCAAHLLLVVSLCFLTLFLFLTRLLGGKQKEDGGTVTKSSRNCAKGTPPDVGSFVFLGSFELEIVACITEERYIQKGMDLLGASNSASSMMTPTQPFKPVGDTATAKKPLWQKKRDAKIEEKAMLEEEEEAARNLTAATPSTVQRGGASISRMQLSANLIIDPSRAGAHLLNAGRNDAHTVSVDPFIGLKLKPHQVDGVKFMYANLTKDMPQAGEASRGVGGGCVQGCILADEMGLGKTIQTIALMWTVLKQSPLSTTAPLVRKCIVVCPSSLVGNWEDEVRKWLGDVRLNTLAVKAGGKGAAGMVQEFVSTNVKLVLIISYDMLRRHKDKLAACSDVQLLVCDEAHKLKNIKGNATIDALNSLPAKRRILLSGTPVQNDLKVFGCVCSLRESLILTECIFTILCI